MSYIGQIPLPQATEERIERTATAGQTSFTGLTYVNGHISAYLNGLKLDNADFTATDGTTVTLATGAAAGDTVSFVSTTQTSALVALPLKDSAGNSVLSEASGVVTLGNVTFPNGHVIQKKAIMVAGVDIGGNYQSFTGFSNFDINLNRTSNTHAIYEVFGSGVSTEASSRVINIAAKRSDGATYSGTNEVNLHTDSEGNGEYFSNSGVIRAPLILKAVDTGNINGSHTYRFFAKASGSLAYFALNGSGDIFVCITEFIPTT